MSDENKFWLLIDLKLLAYSNCIFIIKCSLEKLSFGGRLLAWDSFSCHIMDSVKDKVKENNTDMVVVPGGCTKYIQAPDVCWNAPFKVLVTERYDEWMAEGSQEYTAEGNLKAPPRRKIMEWILEAWKKCQDRCNQVVI